MEDQLKTKQQLVAEINDIRELNDELREAEAERNAALESLRCSEERFRSVAKSAIDAIISIDSHDRITFWNQAATQIFGYSEEETLGQSVTIIVPDAYKDAHRKGVANYLRTGNSHLIGSVAELEGLKENGEIFPIELSLSTWNTREGIFFTGIIRDISDRKRAERELEQRTAEAGQRTEELESLIQMVAHDLKSPIITIGGLCRLLSRQADILTENHRQIVAQVSSAAETVEQFLGDLLDGLSIEYNKPEDGYFDLPDVIAKVLNGHDQQLKNSDIKVQLDIQDGIPQIMGDQRRITQVLDNLIGNAIKHMSSESGPVIQISAKMCNDHAIVSVVDNGVGIPEAYSAKIFDRFFRINKSSHGTGLGLSISKKIVESHGGSIWVESRPGKGANFSFTLPVHK
jgi:PAS domain S-box-containing protein